MEKSQPVPSGQTRTLQRRLDVQPTFRYIIQMPEQTSGSYKCSLKPESLEKAKRELNEDPKQRASQIETLRAWVKSQPHMRERTRTDDAFLLRFLRAAKFSQLRAQQTLENFWTVRTVPSKGVPEWFDQLCPSDPTMHKCLDLGTAVPLPGRDDEGRKVVLVRTGAYDPKIYDLKDVLRIGFLNNDVLLTDEENQVHGIVTLLDFEEFGTSHVWYWNRDTIQKSMKCWQDTYPIRQKGTHFVNTPALFNALNEIFMLFAKEKQKKRMSYHKSDLDSLHAQIPKRLLPTHLGGDAGPIEDLVQEWKKEVMKHSGEFELFKGCGIDEEKRPKIETKSDGWGITGAFRKLNVD